MSEQTLTFPKNIEELATKLKLEDTNNDFGEEILISPTDNPAPFWDIISLAIYLNTPIETLLAIEKAGCRNCYKTYFIDKQSKRIVPRDFPGNLREINAPIEALKNIQKKLEIVFSKFPYNEANKGFVSGKGIKDVLEAVKEGETLIHIDLEKFFDNHSSLYVKGSLAKLFKETYGVQLSNRVLNILIELLCKENKLPQGSPASPILVVTLNKEMDDKLEAIAKEYNLVYARYADDLSFAGTIENEQVQKLITKIVDAVQPFKINFNKLGIMRHSSKPICRGLKITSASRITHKKLKEIKNIVLKYLNITNNFKLQLTSTQGSYPNEIRISTDTLANMDKQNIETLVGNIKNELSKEGYEELKIKPIMYYIQNTKRLLGANIQDGKINFPRKEYENLRLISFLMGRQRAIKHAQYTIENLAETLFNNAKTNSLSGTNLPTIFSYTQRNNIENAMGLLNMYALQGKVNTIDNSLHTSYRNLLRNPLNRKVYQGKLAYIKSIDEVKYTKLVKIENKMHDRCMREIEALFSSVTPGINNFSNVSMTCSI